MYNSICNYQEEELRQSGEAKYQHLNEDLHVLIEVFAPPAEAYARMGHALEEIKKFLIPVCKHMHTHLNLIQQGALICTCSFNSQFKNWELDNSYIQLCFKPWKLSIYFSFIKWSAIGVWGPVPFQVGKQVQVHRRVSVCCPALHLFGPCQLTFTSHGEASEPQLTAVPVLKQSPSVCVIWGREPHLTPIPPWQQCGGFFTPRPFIMDDLLKLGSELWWFTSRH